MTNNILVRKTTTVVVEEMVRVAPVPQPVVKVVPPVAIGYTPTKGDKVWYTGPKGAAKYEVIWVGYRTNDIDRTTLRVMLIGFGGKVKFGTDANKVRPAW
jgi:hypothetical protein